MLHVGNGGAMEEDEATERVQARMFGFFTFPIPYFLSAKKGKLLKRRIYWGLRSEVEMLSGAFPGRGGSS